MASSMGVKDWAERVAAPRARAHRSFISLNCNVESLPDRRC
jgi:hypothetical protein